mgnify:CR=1 FL=1
MTQTSRTSSQLLALLSEANPQLLAETLVAFANTDGGTVVLGGIYEQTERTTITKVPLLGDVPVLGWLFRNRTRVNDRTELMIFITPRVVSERVAAAAR